MSRRIKKGGRKRVTVRLGRVRGFPEILYEPSDIHHSESMYIVISVSPLEPLASFSSRNFWL